MIVNYQEIKEKRNRKLKFKDKIKKLNVKIS